MSDNTFLLLAFIVALLAICGLAELGVFLVARYQQKRNKSAYFDYKC